MTKIDRDSIVNNNTISWTIKPELLNAKLIYKVDIPHDSLSHSKSKEIKFMRSYNKKNKHSKFVFCLYSQYTYFIITYPNPPTTQTQ